MSYEYKALIEQAIIDDDRPLDWEEGFKELDRVYAKAQAFDDVIELQKLKIERFKKLVASTDDLYFKDKYCNSIERAENIIHVLGSHLP